MSRDTGSHEATRARRASEWRAARRAEAAAHEPVDLTLPVALTVLLAIALSALPTIVVDPRAGDGAPWFVSTMAVPAVAVAVVCELVLRTLARPRRLTGPVGWWVLVLPVGVILAGIPGMLASPDYFTPFAETFGMSAVLVLMGMLVGPLLWFFVLFPVVQVGIGVIAAIRGRGTWWQSVSPALIMLPLTAIIVLGGISLDDLGVGAAGQVQFVLALLGVPGSYEIAWPTGLWIVRAVVVGVVAFWTWSAVRGRRRTE